jgi:Domain of unknown function (DUF6458)
VGFFASLIMIAVGAILAFAVTNQPSGIDLDVVGWILMIVGFVGFLLSLAFWSSFWGPGYFRRADYADDGPAYRRRRRAGPRQEVVEEEEVGPPY